MVAVRKEIDNRRVSVGYDRAVDVLYIVLGRSVDSEGDGLPGGIELNFAIDTGEPCGVTVIGYKRNGWSNKLLELGRIAGNHLSVDRKVLATEIQRVVRS